MTITTAQVWNDFSWRLRAFILDRITNEEDADDLLQDIFTKIHNNLPSLKDEGRLTAWVFQITRNAIADYYRQLKVQPPEQALATVIVDNQDDNALNREVAGWLEPMLDSLPEKYRQALRLTELEGMKHRELATELGLSLSAAKMRVRRGREKLKAVLLDCCHFELDRRGNILDYHSNSTDKCDCADPSTAKQLM
ncbi:MAG: RNA polymerase sigma factor SigZ [Candidatus Marinimicrobia bacterium]|nr:RNA polymerase sigma factor SigZ [Candidatus Neomarinimicrobiota bacterium]